MTPLAEISLDIGLQVSGSDMQTNANTERLQASGAKIFLGHKSNQIGASKTVVVSSAIAADNEELLAAKESVDCELLHRSEYLSRLAANHQVIAIAGTHGKTTTAALISHVLKVCNCHPSAAVGGELLNYQRYSLHGSGDYFVIEADESDGSFLNYKPFISLINNIDLDHMEFFKTLEGTQDAFRQFMAQTDQEGWLIANWDDPMTFNTALDYLGERLTFGQRLGSEIRLISRRYEDGFLHYQVMVEHDLIQGKARLMGKHNCQNILACIAVARALELDLKQVTEAIESFEGVKRRLSQVYSDSAQNVMIFDDYAHNPVKIQACIQALTEAFAQHELHVIFQPHRYSRLQTMYNGFIEAFLGSRYVYLLPVFAAGEAKTKDLDMEKLRSDIADRSKTNTYLLEGFPDPATLISAQPTDKKTIFLTVGAGDVNRFADMLRNHLHGKAQE